MGELTHQVSQVARSLFARDAPVQGGLIQGENPAAYNANDPLPLWVIQLVIIIAMTHGLKLLMKPLRQPQVISEVIGGIILGPTVMGRIPGFLPNIFPAPSLVLLNLTSTIGLILFLFLIALEIDVRVIKRNMLAAGLISFAGLVVPLGLGAALGVGLYRQFVDPSVNFGYFVLFSAVAIGITAFPVLCRILAELRLLEDTVGIVTLAAGVGNDVVGWILLALTVALVNADSGLTALWVLLASVGYVLFLLFPIKWVYVWLARRTGSLEQGTPSTTMMTITFIIIFVSAFFTDVIGVHAIFGGFVAGLIIPHENGYGISLVEKCEDLVSILFLPIYFTLSGLRTNLGLLNDGITWGYTILICVVGFSSKFLACGITAYATGFNWRASGAIGSLMSCKGLVELIVLNVGLTAGVLDTRTFSMFVVQAIILTFVTTPLTLLFYSPKHRMGLGNDSKQGIAGDESGTARISHSNDTITRFALVLDKMEQLPAAMTLSQLLQPIFPITPTSVTSSIDEKVDEKTDMDPSIPRLENTPTVTRSRQITINALRLLGLNTRTSTIMRTQEAEAQLYNDAVLSVFRTFGYLNRLLISATLSIVHPEEFPEAIFKHTAETESQLVIIPWPRGTTTSVVESDSRGLLSDARNPFDGVFHRTSTQDQTSSVVYSELIRNVFLNSPSDVALFVDRGLNGQYTGPIDQHFFMPFFGGPDDRLALTFLAQLCSNASVSATVIRIVKMEALSPSSTIDNEKVLPSVHLNAQHTLAAADTVYGQQNTETRLASDTADNIIWDRYTVTREVADRDALSRIRFSTHSSSQPLHTVTDLVKNEVLQSTMGKPVIVVAGRSRRMAVESHQAELRQLILENGSAIGSAVPKTLGDVGAALVATSTSASLLILQRSTS